MTPSQTASLEERVLVLAPTSKDAAMTASIFGRAGVASINCSDMAQVCKELEAGASALLLPEEAVVPERGGRLAAWLAAQPPWSDLPVLVLARPGAGSAAVAQAMDQLGNVTVLERPTRVAALVSAVRTAVRARQRQYQTRDHLSEHKRAEEMLRDADRHKDEFLAILAHELRNPLAPIRNSLRNLRLTEPPDSPAERAVDMMDRQVNHLVRLVDDLLEVSRINRGRIELHREPVEVAAVVQNAVETSRPLIEAGAHELTVSVPSEPLVMEGDFVRLTQVVANLLNNAAKFSGTAGHIRLTVAREGGEVVISVRDLGQGIPVDMLPHVFELFVQVDRRPGRTQGGLGIGLMLVKSLVEMHGGSVQARSEGEGRGTEVVVRLPLVASSLAPARAPVPPAGASSADLASLSILVVDDNRDAADSLGWLLALLGADVHVVYSGMEALEAFAIHTPAVVFLDLGMPGIDGYEAARRIREQAHGRDVTLIALTGWGQEDDRHRARAAGFDHHLVKPADIDSLHDLLVGIGRHVGGGVPVRPPRH